MRSIGQGILKFLQAIGRIPDYLIPKALRGWRTIVLNFAVIVLAILQSIDASSFFTNGCEFIVSVGNLIGFDWACSPEAAVLVWATVIAFINAVMRTISTGSVGEADEKELEPSTLWSDIADIFKK